MSNFYRIYHKENKVEVFPFTTIARLSSEYTGGEFYLEVYMNDGDSRELHGTTAEEFYSEYMDWLEKTA